MGFDISAKPWGNSPVLYLKYAQVDYSTKRQRASCPKKLNLKTGM